MALKELLTVKDLEKKFQVSRWAINAWREKGMPYKTIGRNIRFDPDEVAEWIKQQDKGNG